MIREATAADVPELAALGERFMRESRYSAFLSVNPEAIRALMEMLIAAPHGMILVSEKPDGVVGMIGVIATVHPHSGDKVMSELFWYVKPEERGAGVRLLRAAEKWAKSHGVTKSIVVSPSKKVSAFYRRAGYQRLEEQFMRNL